MKITTAFIRTSVCRRRKYLRPALISTASVLVCFPVSPMVQAVSPAPGGAYLGNNTAEGQDALLSLNVNTGTFNTAVGWFSLKSNVEGQFNTAVGAGALFANTGGGNTAIGAAALFSNTVGTDSTAIGFLALFLNITGFDNTANGTGALFSNTEGAGNTATGYFALERNTIGSDNTADGVAALWFNATGAANSVIGFDSLALNTTGNNNTAIGLSALFNNGPGNANTAVGFHALEVKSTGDNNTAMGTFALTNSMTGSNNIALGAGAGSNIHTASDTICIGAAGIDATDGCYIGHVFEEPLNPDNLPMAIDVNGKLGTPTSSRRFKDDITPMDKASEAILALQPVRFRYTKDFDPIGTAQFGLIAEDVAKVNPDLVVRDKEGKPYSVRYDQVNAMLLNEFLKERKKVEAQEETIAQLKSDTTKQETATIELRSTIAQQQQAMEILTARLQEQAAQIQRVSTQLRAASGGSALQTVSNNP